MSRDVSIEVHYGLVHCRKPAFAFGVFHEAPLHSSFLLASVPTAIIAQQGVILARWASGPHSIIDTQFVCDRCPLVFGFGFAGIRVGPLFLGHDISHPHTTIASHARDVAGGEEVHDTFPISVGSRSHPMLISLYHFIF